MAAVTHHLMIEQGATFSFSLEWRDDDGSDPPTGALIDTDDYDAFLQIRQKPGGSIYASFSSIGVKPAITMDGGLIDVRFGADQTELITKQGVYDLELHNRADPTDVVRLLQGKVQVSLEVTDDQP